MSKIFQDLKMLTNILITNNDKTDKKVKSTSYRNDTHGALLNATFLYRNDREPTI